MEKFTTGVDGLLKINSTPRSYNGVECGGYNGVECGVEWSDDGVSGRGCYNFTPLHWSEMECSGVIFSVDWSV